MRRFAWLRLACTLVVLVDFARAQEVDLAVGGSTPYAFSSTSASQAFPAPPERGGTYPGFSVQIFPWGQLGINAELAFRYHQGLYNDFQTFRPILYDFNAVYTSRIARKMSVDAMAGVGGETLLFYNQYSSCTLAASGCVTNITSNHLMFHLGVGIRYYFLHQFFIRPEAHYYLINNNFEFHSDNLFRAGASIGYTFGRK